MLRNYLKIAFRNLWKNRLFTSINLVGMSVGMACVVVLVLFAQNASRLISFTKTATAFTTSKPNLTIVNTAIRCTRF